MSYEEDEPKKKRFGPLIRRLFGCGPEEDDEMGSRGRPACRKQNCCERDCCGSGSGKAKLNRAVTFVDVNRFSEQFLGNPVTRYSPGHALLTGNLKAGKAVLKENKKKHAQQKLLGLNAEATDYLTTVFQTLVGLTVAGVNDTNCQLAIGILQRLKHADPKVTKDTVADDTGIQRTPLEFARVAFKVMEKEVRDGERDVDFDEDSAKEFLDELEIWLDENS